MWLDLVAGVVAVLLVYVAPPLVWRTRWIPSGLGMTRQLAPRDEEDLAGPSPRRMVAIVSWIVLLVAVSVYWTWRAAGSRT